jgi:hypothetical protein
MRRTLIEEAGGACALCGYSRARAENEAGLDLAVTIAAQQDALPGLLAGARYQVTNQRELPNPH